MESIPKWITKEYFSNILSKEVSNFDSVKKFKTVPACRLGEGTTSDLVRVNSEVQLKDGSVKPFSLVVKSKKQLSADSDKIIGDAGNFVKENEVYDKLLPAFEKLYLDKGRKVKFSPQSYKLSKEAPVETVVLEDLGPQKYTMENRLNGLDFSQLKLTLEKLAEFHAASAVYVDRNGPLNKEFDKGVYDPVQKPYYVAMYQHVVNMIIDSYKKSVKNGAYFADKMFSNFSGLMDRYFDCTTAKSDKFNVLTHGDIWINNIMFKDSDVRFLDYQLSLYSSPALDFIQLLFSSAKAETIRNHFDELLKHYQINLLNNLKLLEYGKPIPTMTDLHLAIYENRRWIIHILNGSLAMALMTPMKDMDLDTILKLDDKGMGLKLMMYSNERYCGRLSELLEWLECRGLLD